MWWPTATTWTVPVASRDCPDSLAGQPLPLFSDVLELAVLWNAKAGCTFASRWLWYQEGLLDEVIAYSSWPHQYRQQVYCGRPGYLDKVLTIPALGPRAIKFVRDPYGRAVSSYLHFCDLADRRTRAPLAPLLKSTGRQLGRFARYPRGRAGGPLRSEARQVYTWLRHEYSPMLRAIGKHLGRHVGHGELFSFREYVSFLGSQDLDEGDVHVRRQVSQCERSGALPDLVVLRIEESAQRLPVLEDALGLRRSDTAFLRRSSHHTLREDLAGFAGDKPFGRTRGVAVPQTHSFYDDALTVEVGWLYAEDLERYGYAFDG